MVDPSNIEDCHWIKPSKGAKKVIVKLSRYKDANKTRLLKKGLKGMNLSITKCCRVNVENFYQTNICTLFG